MTMKKYLNRRGERPYVFRSCWKRWAAAGLDALGALGVWILTRGQGWPLDSSALKNPQKILVARLDHIGDVLFARPALQALRQLYPQAQITALVSSAGAALLARDKFVDKILTWDAPWFDRLSQKHHALTFWQMVQQIRQQDFDLSLDLRGDLRHHILFLLAGIRVRVGYGITGGGFTLHVTRPLRSRIHEVERNLDLVRALGASAWPKNFLPLALTLPERKQGESFWQQKSWRVVVHPSSGDPNKCWSWDFFAAVCRVLSQAGCEILLVGAASEAVGAKNIQGLSGCSLKIKTGQTSLRDLVTLITSADLLIGHDSGPAHIAVTQGIPVIFLWSKTNEPEEWGPWGKNPTAVVIRSLQPETALYEVIAAAKKMLARKNHHHIVRPTKKNHKRTGA